MTAALDAETKRIVEGTLARFVDDAYDLHARHLRLKAGDTDCRRHWATLAELGVLAMPFAESLGGMGGSAVDVADAVRTLARGLIFEPVVEVAVVAGTLMAAGGGANAVADLMAGGTLCAVIGGRPGAADGIVAAKTADGWRLDGKARVAMFAAEADEWLIAARRMDGVPMVVRTRRADIPAKVSAFRLLDGRSAADVEFVGTAVPGTALWLDGPAAREALARAGLLAINAYCADAVGCMARLLDITGEFLRTRRQFGVTIGNFQALRHRYADMHMAYLEALAISGALAVALDAGRPGDGAPAALADAATRVVARAGARIGHEAIQMHGGMGVTDELAVSHYNARLVVLSRLVRGWLPSARPVEADE